MAVHPDSPGPILNAFAELGRRHGGVFRRRDLVGLPSTADQCRLFARGQRDARGVVLAAMESDGRGALQCIGLAIVDMPLDDTPGGGVHLVPGYGTLPDARGQGVASALAASALRLCLSALRESPAEPVLGAHLWCADSNKGGMAVARGLGFADSGHRQVARLATGLPQRTYLRMACDAGRLRLQRAVPVQDAAAATRLLREAMAHDAAIRGAVTGS